MSGGHFDYKQYVIEYIADDIEEFIINNEDDSLNEFGYKRGRFYSKEVVDEFANAVEVLRKAAIYAQRID